MITEIHINTMEELLPLFMDQQYRPDLDRSRSLYVYRGLNHTSYSMVTSLARNCKHLQHQLEPSILRNFAKYAVIEDPTVAGSVWNQMILGRHHGLPTRLLDWSHSALVALHFAVTEENMDKMQENDCLVWRADMKELHSLLPEPYQKVIERYDRDMSNTSMVFIEPPSIDARIVNQYSFFSIVPAGMEDVESFLDKYTHDTIKYIIDKNLRWRIRDMLDELNISERIIYPGLDGLSKWITRHYYVNKEDNQ